ncbi:S-adenosyl-L-methionine-dependent methyltransferase [Hyaloscypha variabilis F]|uniref:S-adenosyl-L-methionine-dependent methyltransferase n=1 Tax=Hyaloscypha variabilis (strain UAMH 11265 / GT02V1 / F) TaxID=1149755 RepID=A0A2J6SEA3_HYAVF|nr:S-adenosyl-L-methionine-dependent methyltransferase [Hyaloscypha variabilis F]
MDAIATQIQNLAKAADEAGRKKVLDALRDLQHTIETPYDVLQRFAGLHLQVAAARIGVDLGIFEALHESKEPFSVAALAEKTGAAPELLGRILRYLASIGQIKETSKDHFSSSTTTAVLADRNYQGGIHHLQDITDNSKTALQKAFNTELPGFIWFPTQPQRFGYFQQVMTVQRAGALNWLSAFPFKEELGEFQGPTVFVDIGGSFGHQCIAVTGAFPELAGKIVLQDLPQTLAHVPAIEGVEITVHNFFEPQIVTGAKFYYLRNILHDWPDDKAVLILKNLIPALGPDSRVLIDDMVLPNENVHWQAAQIYLTMMSSLGSKERTDEQWRALIDAAGLQILKIVPYTAILNDSIIVAVPK